MKEHQEPRGAEASFIRNFSTISSKEFTMKKTAFAAFLSASALAVAGAAFAVDAPAPQPLGAPVGIEQAEQASVSMAAAVDTAEKAYDGKAVRAVLHYAGQYGQVWDVTVAAKDNKLIAAFVDAKTGKVSAAFDLSESGRRGPGFGGRGAGSGYGCPFGGMGPGMGYGMGMGMGYGMGGRYCR
jgi:uncharacterized membrane protein YkoI